MKILTFILIIFLVSCTEKTEKGDKLSQSTIKYIQELGILNRDEKVLYFYTAYNYKISGNYFTKDRVASYWQNKSSKDDYIKSAFYEEIDSIGIKYGDGFEFTSSLIITLKNGEKFNVYFNDGKVKIDQLYEEVKQNLENCK